MSEQRSWPSLVKTSAEATRTVLEVVAPQRTLRAAAQKQIMDAILGGALNRPGELTEAHVAYAKQVFGDDEANFITWIYVQEQSKYYSQVLRDSGFAERALPRAHAQAQDPSFERNLRARLQELSPDDRCILELYAQIRGGHEVCPGAFSKRTCNIVAELTPDTVYALEAIAPYVIRSTGNQEICFVPDFRNIGGSIAIEFDRMLSLSHILILQEYGLAAYESLSVTVDDADSLQLPGGQLVSFHGAPPTVHIQVYALFTRAGAELLQLHDCKPTEGLGQWLLDQFPAQRGARLVG